jgi:hypothetical protein
MQAFRFTVVIAGGIGLGWCSHEPTYTEQEQTCIAQRHADYDAKRLDHCVDVCKACMKGNSVTCHTSCRLRGAS